MTGTRRSKPRYAELGDLLQAAIEQGEYAVGTLLPTELELCARFSVSRHTARAALAQLISAGLVQRRPGAGTRVIARSAVMRYEPDSDTVDLLMQYEGNPHLKLLQADRRQADAAMAEQLDIHQGRDYLRLHCLRLDAQSRQPLTLMEILLPVRNGIPTDRLLDLAEARHALPRLVDPAGLSRVEQVFDAVSLGAADASLLNARKGEAAMRVQRRYHDDTGRLLLLSISQHPPGRFAYATVLSRRPR